jgi:hypothetical protein
MTTLKLTKEDVLNDIERFEKRIQITQEKLTALPQKATGYKERKKLKFKRRILRQEIEHVKRLIAIAKETLPEYGHN